MGDLHAATHAADAAADRAESAVWSISPMA